MDTLVRLGVKRKNIKKLMQKNTCGVDPAWDHLPSEYMYNREIEEFGHYGMVDEVMYTRLCSKCKMFGKDACKEAPTAPRSRIILKKHTHDIYSTCSICYEFMTNRQLVETKCGHTFHHSCFIKWIRQSYPDETCPMCREPIEEVFGDHEYPEGKEEMLIDMYSSDDGESSD